MGTAGIGTGDEAVGNGNLVRATNDIEAGSILN